MFVSRANRSFPTTSRTPMSPFVDTWVPELRDEPDLPLQLIESNLLPNSVALGSFNKSTVERDPTRVGHGRVAFQVGPNHQRI